MGTPAYERWNASRRDTVTGKLHHCCPCGERKFLNDERDDCELNKFDDMMLLSHREVPDFRQVLALDIEFDALTRVWCIAELVQAHILGLPQHVCFNSSEVLDVDTNDLRIYVKLASLKVADCNATREADKADILAKIPDLAEFDSQLQHLIFGKRGLLSKHFIGFDAFDTATRAARRAQAISEHLTKDATCFSV